MRKGFGLPHLAAMLARLIRDEDGSYLLYATILIPVVIGFAGLGTEAGLTLYSHRTLQSAADATAYSAAVARSNDTTADITAYADAIFNTYHFSVSGAVVDPSAPPCVSTAYTTYICNPTTTDQVSVCMTPTTFSGVSAIQVIASRPQTRIFSGYWINNSQPNKVCATAVYGAPGVIPPGNCMLALGRQQATKNGPITNDAPDSIHVQGNANMDLSNCGVYSDSTADCSNAAVTIQGNGSLLAGAFGTAGCVTGNGAHPANIGPPPSTYTEFDGVGLSDPYANVGVPTTSSAGSCTATASITSNGKVQSNGNLCPGVYSNGIAIKGNTVALQPGTYIIQGSFQTGPGGGGTTVTGNGVTLVFTDSSGGMTIDSGSNVTLTAPTTGTTAGFVLMGDYNMPLNTPFNVVANANADLNGTIYLPNGFMNWQGTADTAIGCRQFILNKISLQGNPKLNANGCNDSGGGSAGNGNGGSIVTLVQ